MHKTLSYTKQVLDIWLPEKIRQAEIPGACIGVMHKGKLIYSKGFGFADVEKKVPMSWDASMPIASISKMFTSVALLQLVEQKKIKLTDPIEKYLTWFKTPKNNGFRKPTILDLLTHKSGLKRDGDTYHWIDDQFPDNARLQQSFEEKAFKMKPGERFAYSNFGFALLGLIIEKVSGLTYEKYIQTHIFDKLEMNKSSFCGGTGTDVVGYGRYVPNTLREKTVIPAKTHVYTSATGIVSNVSNLALFMENILNTKSKSPQLLNSASKKLLKEDYFKLDSDEFYGLGIRSYLRLKRKIFGHTGGFSGFSSFVGYEEKSDIGVVVLANGLGVNCGGIGLGIFDAIFRLKDVLKAETVITPKINALHNGLYRSRWSDCGIVAVGKSYVDFSTEDYYPLKFADIFEPEKKTGNLRVKSRSYFGMHKEYVTFTTDPQGREIIDYGSSKGYKS